jgi:adenylate cyclase
VGVSLGYATLGLVGFEGRYDYIANGSVVVLAARLCAEAEAGQIVVSQRVLGALEDAVEAEPLGELPLKGFPRPVPAFNVLRLVSSAVRPPTP